MLKALVVVGLVFLTGCTSLVENELERGQGYIVRQFLRKPGFFDGTSPVRTFRLYLPDPMPKGPAPLVVIAPAGSPLVHGMELVPEDIPEHLPWVRAGYVVISYSIDGSRTEDEHQDGFAFERALLLFERAHAGVDNARAAIDLAFANANIDHARVIAAGHSSAASLALLAATQEPRIKAVAALAPCTDLETRLKEVLDKWQEWSPEFVSFIRWSSPRNRIRELTVPVFLFHAEDDENVPFQETATFARLLTSTGNQHVVLSSYPDGGHYDSMIEVGIGRAVAWAGALPR